MKKLFTNGTSNAKTAKDSAGLESVILHFAPSTLADGRRNVCPWASAGCIASCLNTSGRGQIKGELTAENVSRSPIHRARIARTLSFLDNRAVFMAQMNSELFNLARRAERKGLQPVARPNGTSDIPWEKIPSGDIRWPSLSIMYVHHEIQFYDYTKSKKRALDFAAGLMPPNYHLTYSRTENDSNGDIARLIQAGVNVAVVFSGDKLPSAYLGAEVIDGLASDWRFKDPRGVVVGLLAKGRGKRDTSGFVVDPLPDVLGSIERNESDAAMYPD